MSSSASVKRADVTESPFAVVPDTVICSAPSEVRSFVGVIVKVTVSLVAPAAMVRLRAATDA